MGAEKPILPPKKSTFKNPFKPFLQIKYRPFSKTPFRPSTRSETRPITRPPPPPAPIANTEDVQSIDLSSKTSTLSQQPVCAQKEMENEFEKSSNEKSHRNDVSQKN